MVLSDIVGNAGVKKIVSKYNFTKPVMFEGHTGCGKTTLAFILADRFEAPEENRVYINCAQFSKVEEIRELLQDMGRTSLFGKKKVLILDEVHYLSDKARGVLLIPLETMKDVLYIVCTTTTVNLSEMFLDRFTILRVKPLGSEHTLDLIKKTCERDRISISKPKKKLILDSCNGVPRRIISAISLAKDIDNLEELSYLLEVSSIETDVDLLTLFNALYKHSDWSLVRNILSDLFTKKSYADIRAGLKNIISARVMSKYVSDKDSKLLQLYDLLNGYDDKSSLIMSVYKGWCNG